MLKTPEILFVTLTQFLMTFDNGKFQSVKDTRHVKIPHEINIKPYVSRVATGETYDYKLHGISCHHGSTGGGHCVSYVMKPDGGQWYNFDDTSVGKIQPGYIQGSEDYVLLFKKIHI